MDNIEILQTNDAKDVQLRMFRRNYNKVFLCTGHQTNEIISNLGFKSLKIIKKSGFILNIPISYPELVGLKSGTFSVNCFDKLRAGPYDFPGEFNEQIKCAGVETILTKLETYFKASNQYAEYSRKIRDKMNQSEWAPIERSKLMVNYQKESVVRVKNVYQSLDL